MELNNGVLLDVIKTSKFKDSTISIRFRNTLSEEWASARSLLALLLCDRCAKYDTKQKMSSYMDTLYGASLNAQTMGYGKSQVLEVRLKIMDPIYAHEGNTLMEDSFAFLHEILFSPFINQETFEEAKMMLLAKIQRNEDDPAQFAISQGLKEAGKGSALAISALGEKEIVESLSLEQIQKTYQKMMEEDRIDLLICGNVEEDKVQKMCETYLNFAPRTTELESYYCVSNDRSEECRTSYRKISQTSIMMVWFSEKSVVDKEYYALRVANAMFGQYSTSLLFQEVREKNSLCYSIFSNLISYDGAMGVTTGVEKEQIDKTITLIKQQFKRLVNGDFSEELLSVSKQMITNSLKASKDSMNSLIALQYQNNLLNTNDTNESIIEKVQAVKAEDVVRVLSKCVLKMTYIVTNGDECDA